jgi:TrmH RNA methyltransferase
MFQTCLPAAMPRRRNEARPAARRPAARAPVLRERVHERDLVRICGLAAVDALFARDPARAERLFFEPALAAELTESRRALAAVRKPYREVDTAELARVAGTVRHGGVVAIARPRPVLPLDAERAPLWARNGRPILILDGIANPHNLGAIVRSAAFFGIERIVLADRPDQALPSDASYRVAEGGLEYVSLYRADLAQALPALKRGYRILGTALEGATPLRPTRGGRPAALILGNEENGMAPATLPFCDALVTIPGSGTVQSLNVAVAGGVLLYALTSV